MYREALEASKRSIVEGLVSSGPMFWEELLNLGFWGGGPAQKALNVLGGARGLQVLNIDGFERLWPQVWDRLQNLGFWDPSEVLLNHALCMFCRYPAEISV